MNSPVSLASSATFFHGTGNIAHYDINEVQHAKVLSMGAQLVSSREIVTRGKLLWNEVNGKNR